MKYSLLLFLSFITFACNNNNTSGYQKAEDAEEAAREFIRASLDGDYNKAKFYLYHDSSNTNTNLLARWKKDYDDLSTEDKINYKEASIITLTIKPVNDSTVNYLFTNSFKQKDTTTLRVIKVKGEWLIDFLSTFVDYK